MFDSHRKKKISKLHRIKTVPYISLKNNCDIENTTQRNMAVSQLKKRSYLFLVPIYIKKLENLAINLAGSF